MLGLVYAGAVMVCKAIVGVQNNIEDNSALSEARDSNDITYRDHRGCLRLTSTREPVYFATLTNGDRVLKTTNGRVVYNFSADSKNERLRKKQEEISKDTDQFVVVGRFEDVYPNRLRKAGSLWQYVEPKTLVYKYKPDGRNYFIETGLRFKTPEIKYRFIDIETGRYTFLYQNPNDDDIIDLHTDNKINMSSKLIFDKNCESCI